VQTNQKSEIRNQKSEIRNQRIMRRLWHLLFKARWNVKKFVDIGNERSRWPSVECWLTFNSSFLAIYYILVIIANDPDLDIFWIFRHIMTLDGYPSWGFSRFFGEERTAFGNNNAPPGSSRQKNAKHNKLNITSYYEMKGIVYRDACAGETNGAWGSRVQCW